MEEYDVQDLTIDVRRFASFGVVKVRLISTDPTIAIDMGEYRGS